MLIYFHNSTCEHSHHYSLHQKSVPLLHSMFGSLFYPYLFKKSSEHSPLTLFSSIPQQFFTSLFLRTITPTIYTKNVFSTSAIEPIQAASWDQGAREFYETRHCLISPLFLKVWTVTAGTHNHWLLIAQAQKTGVLQVVVSDEGACNWNGKPFNPTSLIPSTYCQYFGTLLP